MSKPSPERNPRESSQGERYRALAFTGGLDAVTQLGVAHALLVSSARPPDAVVGVSVGAVNAAALAEILQAGESQAQVDKLRKFLDSYFQVPGQILRSMLPDAFEINALQPLSLVSLPIHFREEREDREIASRSRWGLSYLLNKLFGLRIKVSDLAWIVHGVLEIVAAGDLPPLKRHWKRVRKIAGFLFCSWRFLGLAPLFGPFFFAVLRGPCRGRHGATAGRLLWSPIRWMRPIGQGIGTSLVVIAALLFVLATIGSLPLAVVWALSRAGVTLELFNIGAMHFLPIAGLVYLVVFSSLLLILLATFVVPSLQRKRRAILRSVLERILGHLALSDGLGNTYILKQQLVDCFDREYYGKIEMPEVLRKASGEDRDPLPGNPKWPKKKMGDYQCRTPSIKVGAVVAEVSTGDLSVLEGNIPVVDALLAATAYVPFFPAVEIAPAGQSKRFFIDAGNISREAVGPLLNLIRNEERLDRVDAVDVYPVHRLLADTGLIEGDPGNSLIRGALRALQLHSLRDATIEQRLTRLISKTLPPTAGRVWVGGRAFVRAEVLPLGVNSVTSLGREAWSSSKFDLREAMYREVADGCRAALEGMIPGAIAQAAQPSSVWARLWKTKTQDDSPPPVPCRDAIRQRLGPGKQLPGSEKSPGPGLGEICSRCVLRRAGTEVPQHLCAPTGKRKAWPEWPVRGKETPGSETAAKLPIRDSPAADSRMERREAPGWPLARGPFAGTERPLVSLLFGGGVFRGVFHMGVLNALNEVQLRPDIVAGSSVGSIIAAMVAQAFAIPDDKQRRGQIARLAATFLTIDKLVLTDRLADFIRGLTVRAGEARFAPRDLDLVLRRYDLDGTNRFGRRLRRVAAGFERLLYLSPFDLLQLVEAARTRRFGKMAQQLEVAVQRFLQRSGVGQEILGAEPLALLIRSHVIEQLAAQGNPEGLFSSFIDKGVFFFATATNLTHGKLEILGERGSGCEISLLEGLLAGSAFPAVFRPRQAWEVFRSASTQDRYFDGGIMDNLPLDAVAQFLHECQGIARRPRVRGRAVPHLLFTASLEVDKQSLANDRAEVISRSFMRLRSRAQTFTYNRKIDTFAKVQQDLRTIYEANLGRSPMMPPPLDLHLIAVKPEWLCDTFGFHPMLGFRSRKQAQSIAHGCASTLGRLYVEKNRGWTEDWGIEGLDRIDASSVVQGSERFTLVPNRKNKAVGDCWFRIGVSCPFSRASLATLSLGDDITDQLEKIYKECGEETTHVSIDGFKAR